MDNVAHVIVLGNGFDLDCGLPTKYEDFLDFVQLVGRDLCTATAGADRQQIIDGWCSSARRAALADGLTSAFLTAGDDDFAMWLKLAKENVWVERFRRALDDSTLAFGTGWVDFEAEVAQVIVAIEASMCMVMDHGQVPFFSSAPVLTLEDRVCCLKDDRRCAAMKRMLDILTSLDAEYGAGTDYKQHHGPKLVSCDARYSVLRDRLLADLEAVRLGLQIYLHDFVGRIDPVPSDGVKMLCDEFAQARARGVLSFNYTNTFAKVFKKLHADKAKDVKYCFLHGTADSGTKTCNMVLGINEYRDGYAAVQNLDFIRFRKYFQRIYYGNDSSYLQWVDEFPTLVGIGTKLRMSIYGHSLAVTDKDVLCRFILTENMRTTVYYHSSSSLAEKIAGMTALITPDELIKRTGDNVKSLVFRDQTVKPVS